MPDPAQPEPTAIYDADPEQTQWSIFWHGGGNASWLSRGALKFEGAIPAAN